jgi:LPS export ABC transporter protein LptC/lipopolysaccharide transport protein LptA
MISKVIKFLSVSILLGSVWIFPYELDATIGGIDTGAPSVPEYLMRQMRYVLLSEGKLQSEMFADESRFHLELQELHANAVDGNFFNEQGAATNIKSDFAHYLMKLRLLHLKENVVCTSPDKFIMRTPEADYDLNKKFFVANHDVSGNTENNELKFWGDRGESYVDTKTANLFGNARAEYLEPKQGLTKIRGDRALIDRSEGAVTFFDKVKINQTKYDVDSNTASLFYSKPTKALQYMVARENVEIREQSGRHTRSQEAQFFSPTNTIVLIGFPSVYDGEDVVTGDRITLYKNTGVVEVTSANAAMLEQKAPDSKEWEDSKEDKGLSEEDSELIF